MAERGRSRGSGRNRRRGRLVHPEIINFRPPVAEHPWLQFPENLPPMDKAKYNLSLRKNLDKRIMPGYYVDWDLLNTSGMADQLIPFLRQEYTAPGDAGTFTCDAWRNLFNIHETVYRELCLEFFSTIKFNDLARDPFEDGVIQFRLGGIGRTCSLADFGIRLGLYSEDQVADPLYQEFLDSCVHPGNPEFEKLQFWRSLSESEYDQRRIVEGNINRTVFRMLHRLIATTINHRRGSEKVNDDNLFYLWVLSTPDRSCDLPRETAYFLSQKATGLRDASMIGGGQYVTKLAKTFDVLTPEILAKLTPIKPRRLTGFALEQMQILSLVNSRYVMREDGPVHQTRNVILQINLEPEHEAIDIDESEEESQPPLQRRRICSPHPETTEHSDPVSLQLIFSKIEAIGQGQKNLERSILILAEQQEAITTRMSWICDLWFADHPELLYSPSPFRPGTHDNEAGTSGVPPDDDDTQ